MYFFKYNNDLGNIIIEIKEVKTTAKTNNVTIKMSHNINTSNPLFIQFQSNTSNAYITSYYITNVGEVKIKLSEELPIGNWKFNIFYHI